MTHVFKSQKVGENHTIVQSWVSLIAIIEAGMCSKFEQNTVINFTITFTIT